MLCHERGLYAFMSWIPECLWSAKGTYPFLMPHISILSAILIWSSLGLMVRLSGVSVPVLLFYSTLFSLLFQAPLFLFRRIRREFPEPRRLPFIMLLALCLLLNMFSFLFAYSKTTVANAVLSHYIAPVIVAFLAVIFLKEKLRAGIVLAIVLSSIGLWIMLGGAAIVDCVTGVFSEGLSFTPDLVGVLSGLFSGFAYAVLIILARVFTQRFSYYVLVFLQNAFIVIMLLPFIREFPVEKTMIFAVMGLFHSTLAPYLYYRGMRYVTASTTAILGYFEPFGAIVLSMVFLSEVPGVNVIAGGLFILVSGYITIHGNGGGVDMFKKRTSAL